MKYNGSIINNDLDVHKFFLEKVHVAVVPGVAFNILLCTLRLCQIDGIDGGIKRGLYRIEEAVTELIQVIRILL